MQRFITISILIAALALSGCATKPYVSNPKHSFAWNVAKAGGLIVKDVPWEKVQKAREEALAKGAPVDSGPSALGAATYGVVHGLNMGSLLSGGLGALAWLSVGNSDPAANSQILAWMPKEMASTREEAHAKMSEMFRMAMSRALEDTPSLAPYHPISDLEKRSKVSGLYLDGGECSQEKVVCRYPGKILFSPNPGFSPVFLGSSPSWVWSHVFKTSEPIGVETFKVGSWKAYAKLPDVEVYTKASAYLPEWAFIYLSPTRQVVSDGGKYLQYAVILNQGRIHFFVEPPPQNL